MPELDIIDHDGEAISARLRLRGADAGLFSTMALLDIAHVMRAAVAAHAPKRSGRLAASVSVSSLRLAADGSEVVVSVGAPYASFVDQGTGIFGKAGMPIRPRTGNFLTFEAGGKTIFTRSVKGQRAQHFVAAGRHDAEGYIEPRLEKLSREIGNI
jgi:hypothetical protein